MIVNEISLVIQNMLHSFTLFLYFVHASFIIFIIFLNNALST